MLRHNSRNGFLFELGNIFDNFFIQKSKNMIFFFFFFFLQKNHFFGIF